MGRSCIEIEDWIEEEVQRPIEEWEERAEERCRRRRCKWWCACCNKWFCWIEVVLVKVIKWVTEIVKTLVTRVVCFIINTILDGIGFVVGLILSIPIIGGIIRTILNWIMEIVWRLVGLIDFLASLVGIRPRKKLYFGIVIPIVEETELATNTDLQPLVEATIELFDRTCSIDAKFTGFCRTSIDPPGGSITVDCNGAGFFSDWWLDGSWFELVSRTCKFESNWRRLVGYGGEIIVFVVNDIQPGATNGCSMSGTHDYVTVEATSLRPNALIAHEIGHACLLSHNESTDNLMNSSTPSVGEPLLNNWQSSVVRWSRHVTYF